MCTGARNLLLKLDRVGDLRTEPFQRPRAAERPGIRSLEDAVYRWVAAHRHRFPGTTLYCQSNPVSCRSAQPLASVNWQTSV